MAFRAFVTLLKVNLGQKLWLFLESQLQKIKSRSRLTTFFKKRIQRLDTTQFSLKKTDSSGFFYVLTVVTYTQRSFRAEEPGASEVLSSIFCHHTFYTTRIRFLSTHTVALSQEGVFHHERICLIASNKFHHLSPHL